MVATFIFLLSTKKFWWNSSSNYTISSWVIQMQLAEVRNLLIIIFVTSWSFIKRQSAVNWVTWSKNNDTWLPAVKRQGFVWQTSSRLRNVTKLFQQLLLGDQQVHKLINYTKLNQYNRFITFHEQRRLNSGMLKNVTNIQVFANESHCEKKTIFNQSRAEMECWLCAKRKNITGRFSNIILSVT